MPSIIPNPKAIIAQNFSACAAHYDAHASLQRRVAHALAARTRAASAHPARLLEIGCGTGYYTCLLAAAYPDAAITAIDIAPGMLAVAREAVPTPRVSFQLADVADGALDTAWPLITANATLHWLADLPVILARLADSLAPGGVFTATLFGPRTYFELDDALQRVFGATVRTAASNFSDRATLEAGLAHAFPAWNLDEVSYTDAFPTLRDLLRHIRATGTRGDAPVIAWTPRRLARVEDAYRAYGDGVLTATSQLFYVEGRR